MSNKTLAKLKREELLDLLYEQEKRIEELETKNKQLEEELKDRRVRIAKVGSIAEASLALSNVFAEAQKACDLYLENVQGIVREKQTDKYVFPAVNTPKPQPQQAKPVQQAKPQPQAKPAQTKTQQKSANQKTADPQKNPQQKPAYVGRHSRSGNSEAKK